MATTDETVSTISSSEEENGGYETEERDIDDGDSEGEDPTFDILEETRSSLSRMSLNKTRPRVSAKKVVGSDKDTEGAGVEVPMTDEKDGKCIDKVEKMIKDGQVEKFKVDQCKVYLKNHGLRMTGNKNVLIGRIKEHLQVIDGGGERIYPESSFLINCQGDACTGDVLMFEQKVYDMFNIASRSATGPPCGTRIVAGRVVKESYGAAKQQHTFTIEVLWSRGEKPLPPLYPLLIKGRNLYRLKTVRQKWVDELERARVLQEKHMRGGVARYSREVRVQEKEMKKMNRGRRLNNGILPQRQEVQLQPNAILTQVQMPVTLHQKQHQHNSEAFRSNQYIQYQNPSNSNVQGVVMVRTVRPCATQEQHSSSVPQAPVLKKPCNPQISNPVTAGVEKNRSLQYQNHPNCTVQGVVTARTVRPSASQEQHHSVPQAHVLKKPCDPQISYNVSAGVEKNPPLTRQPFSDMNSSLQSRGVGHQIKQHPPVDNYSSLPHSPRQWDGGKAPISSRNEFNARRPQLVNYSSPPHSPRQWHGQKTTAYSNAPPLSPRNEFDVRQPMSNFNCQPQSPLKQPSARCSTPHFDDGFNSRPTTSSPYRPQVRPQLCRYHLQGRCYYRENCRFLHG